MNEHDRLVDRAARDAHTVTVASGLSAGERVVTAGVHALAQGQTVINPDRVLR